MGLASVRKQYMSHLTLLSDKCHSEHPNCLLERRALLAPVLYDTYADVNHQVAASARLEISWHGA